MSLLQTMDRELLGKLADLEQLVSVLEVLATIAAALIAGWALGYASAQVSDSRETQREATAKDWFHDYEVRCFENPKFANPTLAEYDYAQRTIDGDPLMFEKYEWFVSLMLNAGEAITELTPTADWRNSVKSQVKFHHDYLRSSHVQQAEYLAENYCERFQALVREALDEVEAQVATSTRP